MSNLFNSVKLSNATLDKPVIENPGWYLISTDKKNQLIKSVVHSYKKNTSDIVDIYFYAFFYNEPWDSDDNFTYSNWQQISVLKNMNPNMGYWVFVRTYNNQFII